MDFRSGVFAGDGPVEQLAATTFTQTTQAAHHQRVGKHCRRKIDEFVQFPIVVLSGNGEPRADGIVAILVEQEPAGLELDDGCLALGQGHFVTHDVPSLPARTLADQASDRCSIVALFVCAGETHGVSTQRPFLIGVAGGTCSGKTTVSERLAAMAHHTDDQLAVIKLDSYYRSHGHLSFQERVHLNYDHPDAFDWVLLNDHLAALCAGTPVPVPVYDFANHDRSDEVREVRPASIVVVEGILVLWEPVLRERFDLKVYIDTDADIRLIRRLQRDVTERGRTPDNIIEQYLATVRPSHEQFIEPSKRFADVIFPEGGLNEPAIDMLMARVRELTT